VGSHLRTSESFVGAHAHAVPAEKKEKVWGNFFVPWSRTVGGQNDELFQVLLLNQSKQELCFFHPIMITQLYTQFISLELLKCLSCYDLVLHLHPLDIQEGSLMLRLCPIQVSWKTWL
jgi:hypothetical protein